MNEYYSDYINLAEVKLFMTPVAIAGTYCFCPVCLLVCGFVGLFVGWTTLTLIITFKPFVIEPLYLACKFLVTRASHANKKF